MAPIIFAARGLDLDTRLWVLGQEYHVHSAILKLKSEFFFKFMDSPDKTLASKTCDGFKYEWVSRVDEDYDPESENDIDTLSWQMTAKGNDEEEESKELIEKDSKCELAGFHNLLCAMYTDPYHISNMKGLATIIKLADYYLALPAVSSSLSTVLANSYLKLSLLNPKVPEYAYKLRHPILLHEFVVHFAGLLQHCKSRDSLAKANNWREEIERNSRCPIRAAFEEIDPKIQHLILKAVDTIDLQLDIAYSSWQTYTTDPRFTPRNVKALVITPPDPAETVKSRFPDFYRDVRQKLPLEQDYADLGFVDYHMTWIINGLLRSNLRLRGSLFSYRDTKVAAKDVFLCGGVPRVSAILRNETDWTPEFLKWCGAENWQSRDM